MSKMWLRPKDPDEVLDYGVDWTKQMTRDADAINSSTWIVPTGITQDSADYSPTMTKIWTSGGTAGQTYDLVNRIVTVANRTFDQTCRLKVRDR
jgi:hypothetical protein